LVIVGENDTFSEDLYQLQSPKYPRLFNCTASERPFWLF